MHCWSIVFLAIRRVGLATVTRTLSTIRPGNFGCGRWAKRRPKLFLNYVRFQEVNFLFLSVSSTAHCGRVISRQYHPWRLPWIQLPIVSINSVTLKRTPVRFIPNGWIFKLDKNYNPGTSRFGKGGWQVLSVRVLSLLKLLIVVYPAVFKQNKELWCHRENCLPKGWMIASGQKCLVLEVFESRGVLSTGGMVTEPSESWSVIMNMELIHWGEAITLDGISY